MLASRSRHCGKAIPLAMLLSAGQAFYAVADSPDDTATAAAPFIERFDPPWPNSYWILGDTNAGSGTDTWDEVACNYHLGAGTYSGWCAGTGSQPDCGSHDTNMTSYMCVEAEYLGTSVGRTNRFYFWRWGSVEDCCDGARIRVEGYRFYQPAHGYQQCTPDVTFETVSMRDTQECGLLNVNCPFDCHNGKCWKRFYVELPANFDPMLYVRVCFLFDSDGTVVEEGAYFDDIEFNNGSDAQINPTAGGFAGSCNPTICREPSSLTNQAPRGQNAPNQNFTVWNCGRGTLSYSITDNVNWLNCIPSSGTSTSEQDTITCAYTSSGLACGSYSATITIAASAATNTPQVIAVSLTITASPTIGFFPPSLTNSTPVGQNAPSQTFEVWNSGCGTLSYSISDNATWLACTPTSGSSTGEHDIVTCSYSTTALACGSYSAIITASATGATNTPQTISVALTVTGPPSIGFSPQSLTNSTPVGQNAAPQTFEVWNSGNCGTMSYTISDNMSWLSCAPASGTCDAEHDAITCTYNSSGLACGNYSGTITISAPGATNTPRTIPVSLSVIGQQPSVCVEPTQLAQSCPQGLSCMSQQFALSSCGGTCGGLLSYSISDDGGWLNCTPASGSVSENPAAITCEYDLSGLSPATYQATVTINAPDAANTPFYIPVTLTVDPPPEDADTIVMLEWGPTNIVRDNLGAVSLRTTNLFDQNAGPSLLTLSHAGTTLAQSQMTVTARSSVTLTLFFHTDGLPAETINLTAVFPPPPWDSDPNNNSVSIPLAVAAETQAQTLVVSDFIRIADRFSESERDALSFDLVRLTTDVAVSGVVVDVHASANVATAFWQWDAAPQDQPRANNVVGAIDAHIQGLISAQYNNVTNLVIVGTDEVVPFYRYPIPDLLPDSVDWPESLYGDLQDSSSTVRHALAANQILTDSHYADRENTSPPIPDYAIGRLIETPAQVRAQIDRFLSAGGVILPGTVGLAAADFITDMGERERDLLSEEFPSAPTTECIGNDWTNLCLESLLMNPPSKEYIGIHTHARHWLFQAGTNANPHGTVVATPAYVGDGIQRSLILTNGCHAGLNVSDDNDWAELFLQEGAAGVVGNTTYGWGSPIPFVVMGGEALYLEVARNLAASRMSIGQALSRAKASYAGFGLPFLFDPQGANIRTLLAPTLYGIPHYRYGNATESGVEPEATASALFRDLRRLDPTHEESRTAGGFTLTRLDFPFPSSFQEHRVEGIGTYLTAPGGLALVRAAEPILPAAAWVVNPTGQQAELWSHGAVILLDDSSDDIVRDQAVGVLQNTDAAFGGAFTEDEWWPPTDLATTSIEGPSGRENMISFITAQYHSPSQTRRKYNTRTIAIYYSDNPEADPPDIAAVTHGPVVPEAGAAVEFRIDAFDETGICEVFVRYSLNGGATWRISEPIMSPDADGAWRWTLEACDYTDALYYVSAVDWAGNVTTDKNGGGFYAIHGKPCPFEGGNADADADGVCDCLDACQSTPGGCTPVDQAGCCTRGACCFDPLELCIHAERFQCEALAGTYVGHETVCCGNMPCGSADGDCDVDLVDFGHFQVCFSGAGIATADGCGFADLDGDGDVDLDDWKMFQFDLRGP